MKLMQINRVPVADIIEKDRLRPVSEAGVESLIASVTETGVMKDAIHVRKKHDGKFYLIAGGHRLEMARRLGWTDIEAKVWTEVTDDWARMMEIDDNLAGAEMNALDTAVFLATRKAVYERIHPEAKHGVAGGLARQGLATDIVSFAASAADKMGCTTRHVERMVAAGTKLGPREVHQLRSAPRPITLKDLTEIAKIKEPVDRYGVVDRLATGSAKSASDALRAIRAEAGGEATVKDPVHEEFAAILRAWDRAGAAARARFLEERGAEILSRITPPRGIAAK